MTNSEKIKNILWIALAGGSLIYLYNCFLSSLASTLLTLILILVLFTAASLFFNVFDIAEFMIILSISGFLVSLTILFHLGIEEVPYPNGAFLFHIDGILKSLIIAFLSSVPLLILFKTDNNIIQTSSNLNYNDDEWDVATDDDLSSGQFEIK